MSVDDAAEKEPKGKAKASAATETVVRLQIYAHPAIPTERLLLDLWEATGKSRGRAQEVFRRALILGFRQMCESGELEDGIVDAVGEDRILGRPRRRRGAASAPVFVLPAGMDPRLQAMPQDGYAPVLEAPRPRPAPAPAPRPAPEPEPECLGRTDALGDLM